jgi:hypothetical protein
MIEWFVSEYQGVKRGIMLISILEKVSDAESLLNSLYEAEFNLEDVSVLMADMDLRDKIAKDAGPLKGVTPSQLKEKLKMLGVNEKTIGQCVNAIKEGKILILMNVDSQYSAVVEEIFEDHSANLIKGS